MDPYQPSQRYFPHIDGLRALAVLAVIVFHAFPTLLPGGFIGVDVFFVISGFLITKLILEDIDHRNFSIRRFYARRTQRIFPALMLVLLTGWCVGWYALTSNEYSKYGKYMAGGAVFLDNFMFWRDAGYFDSKPDTKPLLHLWSLGVEEQFYLVWPWMMVLFARTKHAVRWTIFVLTLSFAYNIYLANSNLVGDFYSPLTRFWELGSGAVLALLLARKPLLWQALFSGDRAKWLALTGLIIMAIALIFINPSMAYPGHWAMWPVMATLLLIAAGDCRNWVSRTLTHPVAVHLGLISYPLYLWHWPLLSFARIFNGSTPTTWVRLELLALAFVLAELTYQLLEKPMRSTPPSRLKITALLVLMSGVFALGHWVSITHGLAWRNHDKLKADPVTMVVGADRDQLLRECLLEHQERRPNVYCLSNKTDSQAPIWLVIGDSKAEAIYYGLVRESPEPTRWVLMGGMTAINIAPWSEGAINRWTKNPQVVGVVFAGAWRSHTPTFEDTDQPLKEPDAALINQWIDRYEMVVRPFIDQGKKVIVLRDNPTLPDPNDCIAGQMVAVPLFATLLTRHANPLCSQKLSDHLRWTSSYDELTSKLVQRNPRLKIFNPLDALCDSPNDRCEIYQGDKFLYSYGDHLSDYANSMLARKMFVSGLFQ